MSYRRAFTVIELLIVISIIGIICTLAFPALLSSKQSADSFTCQSKLRQLGLAVTLFEGSHKFIPGNGGYESKSKIVGKDGVATNISTEDFVASTTYNWGIGNPQSNALDQPGSWAYAILPYLEEQKAYADVNVERQQPLFLCPSRARRKSAPTANDQFGNYVSGGFAWAKTDYNANSRLCASLPLAPLPLSGVHNGASNVMLIGEKSFDYAVHTPTTWYWDEPIFSGGAKGTARAGLLIVNDGLNIPYKENWGSAHLGKINIVRLDASTDSLSSSVDRLVLRDLLSVGQE